MAENVVKMPKLRVPIENQQRFTLLIKWLCYTCTCKK